MPSLRDLLDSLDEVSAIAETLMLYVKQTPEDFGARTRQIRRARRLVGKDRVPPVAHGPVALAYLIADTEHRSGWTGSEADANRAETAAALDDLRQLITQRDALLASLEPFADAHEHACGCPCAEINSTAPESECDCGLTQLRAAIDGAQGFTPRDGSPGYDHAAGYHD